MSLTNEDKKFIQDSIKFNNRELITLMFQHFPTRGEVIEIVEKVVNTKLMPIKDLLFSLGDSVAEIKDFLRTDYVILENQVIENTREITQIKTRLDM